VEQSNLVLHFDCKPRLLRVGGVWRDYGEGGVRLCFFLQNVDGEGTQNITILLIVPLTLNLFFTPNLTSSYLYYQEKCILRYSFTAYTGLYGFELVVEDFPRSTITLTSTTGNQTSRSPLSAQRRKRALYLSHYGYLTTTTTDPTTTTVGPTTTTVGPTTTTAGPTTKSPSKTVSNPVPLSKLPLQFSLIGK